MRWVTRPWRQAFKLRGRVTRRAYWLFQVQLLAVYLGTVILLGQVYDESAPDEVQAIMAAAVLLVMLFLIVVWTPPESGGSTITTSRAGCSCFPWCP